MSFYLTHEEYVGPDQTKRLTHNFWRVYDCPQKKKGLNVEQLNGYLGTFNDIHVRAYGRYLSVEEAFVSTERHLAACGLELRKSDCPDSIFDDENLLVEWQQMPIGIDQFWQVDDYFNCPGDYESLVEEAQTIEKFVFNAEKEAKDQRIRLIGLDEFAKKIFDEYWETHDSMPRKFDGYTVWFDKDGHYHRDGKPAAICDTGAQYWFVHGKMHRVDGPAFKNKFWHEWWLNNEEVKPTYDSRNPLLSNAIVISFLICSWMWERLKPEDQTPEMQKQLNEAFEKIEEFELVEEAEKLKAMISV